MGLRSKLAPEVVGAGYSLSTEVGDTSTITKLFRVAMLVPVVFVLSVFFGRHDRAGGQAPVPAFVLVFCLLVGVNSAGWIPDTVGGVAQGASSWCLVAAIAGLGVKTSLQGLARMGLIPVAILVAESLFLAGWVLGGSVWLL
jgi:uncharacterized membrane protein YadS